MHHLYRRLIFAFSYLTVQLFSLRIHSRFTVFINDVASSRTENCHVSVVVSLL